MQDVWKSLGHRPAGEHLEQLRAADRFDGRRFHNDLAAEDDLVEAMRKWMAGGSPHREPASPPAVFAAHGTSEPSFASEALRLTWIGHSTLLIEVDGHRILTDPVWSERVSPFENLGSKRFFAPPMALDELPEIDAIVISHDHYDHLDRKTIEYFAKTTFPFYVPLGVGSHLEYWGVAAGRIEELDWWQSRRVGELELVSTPARHFSGRHLVDRDATLWSGWAILDPSTGSITRAIRASSPASPRSARASVPSISA